MNGAAGWQALRVLLAEGAIEELTPDDRTGKVVLRSRVSLFGHVTQSVCPTWTAAMPARVVAQAMSDHHDRLAAKLGGAIDALDAAARRLVGLAVLLLGLVGGSGLSWGGADPLAQLAPELAGNRILVALVNAVLFWALGAVAALIRPLRGACLRLAMQFALRRAFRR